MAPPVFQSAFTAAPTANAPTANAPTANAPIPKIFLHEEQERILNALNKGNYTQTADAFEAADQQYSPNFSVSRINPSVDPNWQGIAMFLILRLDIRVLRAILDNSLPRRALLELKHEVRRPVSVNIAPSVDPVGYLNWLADETGGGLTIPAFEDMLDVMEVVAGLSPRQGNPHANQQALLYARVKAAFATVNRGLFFIEELRSSPKANDHVNFQSSVKEMVQHNRDTVLPRARRGQVDQIMVQAEAGWTMHFSKRAEDHKSMRKNSPPIFKLINCTLRALFPARRFKLHQFAIFNIVREDEAAIAETLLSHAGATYATYGGCNFDVAGVTTSRVWSAEVNWMKIGLQAEANGYLRHVESNVQAWEASLEQQNKEITKREEQEMDRVDQRNQLHSELDQSLDSLIAKNDALRGQLDENDVLLARLTEAERGKEQKGKSDANAHQALVELNNGLARVMAEKNAGGEDEEDPRLEKA